MNELHRRIGRWTSLVALLWSAAGVSSASQIDLGDFTVNAKSSYLRGSVLDSPVSPLFIDLSALSTPVHAGDTLTISTIGDYCNMIVNNQPCVEMQQALGGLFSSLGPTSLLGITNLNRLPGAIQTPGVADSPDPNAWYGSLNTSISQDFQLPSWGVTVVVPTSAQFLVVGVLDSYYGDNADANGNLGIHLCLDQQDPGNTVTVLTPEPGTYGMLLAGIGGLWGFRRYRLRRR